MTNNKLIVPEAEFALNQLKEEVAAELGITIHPDMTSREAGKIGGNVTKKLIELGQLYLQTIHSSQNLSNNKVNEKHQLFH